MTEPRRYVGPMNWKLTLTKTLRGEYFKTNKDLELIDQQIADCKANLQFYKLQKETAEDYLKELLVRDPSLAKKEGE